MAPYSAMVCTSSSRSPHSAELIEIFHLKSVVIYHIKAELICFLKLLIVKYQNMKHRIPEGR